MFYIWSNEHRAWWGPGECGYSERLSGAGRYTRDQAIRICRDALPTSMHCGCIAEVMVPVEEMREMLNGALIPGGIV